MRKSLQYKHSAYRKTVGFIELDTTNHSLNLKIFQSCPKYRPKIKKMYEDILKILEKNYDTIGSKKFNPYQQSIIRRKQKWKKQMIR